MGRHKNISIECPRHGIKYIVTELGGVRYCSAPTPGELTAKCFYHPTNRCAIPKERIDTDTKQPDVFRAMEQEWEMHKKFKVINRENMQKRRIDYVPAEIQSPGEILMASSRNTKRKDGPDKKLPALTYESIVEDDDDISEAGNFLE